MANWPAATPAPLTKASGPTVISVRAEIPSKPVLPKSSATSSGTSSSVCHEVIEDLAMQFGLNENQEFLRDSARKFFAGECPIAEVRRLMETDTAFDAKLWAKLAEQRYTGIIFPEELGGVGLGIVELILLMEEAGRALLPGPFFSSVVMAGALVDAPAPKEKKKSTPRPSAVESGARQSPFFRLKGAGTFPTCA